MQRPRERDGRDDARRSAFRQEGRRMTEHVRGANGFVCQPSIVPKLESLEGFGHGRVAAPLVVLAVALRALRCNQVQSDAIRRNQRQSSSWRLPCEPSGAIRRNQTQSDAISATRRLGGCPASHQAQSGAISGTHARMHAPTARRA